MVVLCCLSSTPPPLAPRFSLDASANRRPREITRFAISRRSPPRRHPRSHRKRPRGLRRTRPSRQDEHLAYPTVLARYAMAQVATMAAALGTSLNCHEVLSRYCPAERLQGRIARPPRESDEDQWQEAVVQDTRSAPVSDTVAFRVRFRRLPRSAFPAVIVDRPVSSPSATAR